MTKVTWLLLALGACSVVAGIALMSYAAALIVGGLLAMTAGVLAIERPATAAEGRRP